MNRYKGIDMIELEIQAAHDSINYVVVSFSRDHRMSSHRNMVNYMFLVPTFFRDAGLCILSYAV